MRPIDADGLKYRRKEYGGYDDVPMEERRKGILYLLKEDIDDSPTIDVVPVRHGLWKKHPIDSDWDVCSYCGLGTQTRFHYNEGVYGGYDEEVSYSYCPNCGARMERSEEWEFTSET